MPASRSCMHPAIIQAVGSRHSAPCHGVTLLQSRRSQVVITHHATVSPYCNPGGRKSSCRRNAESSQRHPTLRIFSGYRVKRGMTTWHREAEKQKGKNVFCKERQILMPDSRSCKHPAIIQAVSNRHSAPRHVPTLLQSRLSVAIIPHHATCSSYCNPGSRKSSFRRNAESSQRHPTLRMFPGYRVKRGMTTWHREAEKQKGKNVFCKERQILMPASRSCKHPAIILAVSNRHSAPRHVPTLLQSRQSVVVMPHRATVAPYCNPGCRKSSFRTMPRWHPTAIQAVGSRHSAEMRNPVFTTKPFTPMAVPWIPLFSGMTTW